MEKYENLTHFEKASIVEQHLYDCFITSKHYNINGGVPFRSKVDISDSFVATIRYASNILDLMLVGEGYKHNTDDKMEIFSLLRRIETIICKHVED